YLVATPIGNLEDVTLRALRILKEADLIACEDTRHSRRLLDHYGISRPTISYHEHNERARAAELTERLLRGENIAVITDAGMPGISDPAYRLVTAAIEQGVGVIPIPGPTALITGLVASGLPTDSFLFVGFLPAKRQARRAKLESLRTARETLVAYEAPHRIQETLLEAREVLGDRQAALARELTLVIAGCGDEDLGTGMLPPEARSLREQINHLVLTQGLSRNEALKQTARRHGLSKKEAYRLMLAEEPSGNEGREEDQPPEKESDDRER